MQRRPEDRAESLGHELRQVYAEFEQSEILFMALGRALWPSVEEIGQQNTEQFREVLAILESTRNGFR